ncbi:Homocysteine S-methyltransferase [Enhygromyxa salina]|uniref:Homocysteine S-methyltransferase n=2 Tax=Enhygromyxa salina TaxID=215803 RepID=A0A0C2D4G4_9BACT|nr:Homocysteine S-methyltransferase [Enhygromyxa salina]
MGTELAERGFELRPPLFSARALLDAPELVEQIHWDYLCAGAQVLTTNSFGLHAASLAAAGIGERQAELVRRSVQLIERVRARALAEQPAEPGPSSARFRIAGSIPPRVRAGERALGRAEYRAYANALITSGVDLLLLETFTNVDDARVALEGLVGVELPVWLSVVAGGTARSDGARLLGGDSFEDLAQLLRSETHRVPDALLINCTQIDAIPAALDAMIQASADVGLPLGLRPHLGRRRYDGVWIDRIVEPEVFAGQIQAWMRTRPQLIIAGACCGSRPDYIAATQRALMPSEAAREQAFVRLAELVP